MAYIHYIIFTLQDTGICHLVAALIRSTLHYHECIVNILVFLTYEWLYCMCGPCLFLETALSFVLKTLWIIHLCNINELLALIGSHPIFRSRCAFI